MQFKERHYGKVEEAALLGTPKKGIFPLLSGASLGYLEPGAISVMTAPIIRKK